MRPSDDKSSFRLRIAVEGIAGLLGISLVALCLRMDRTWFETHALWRCCALDAFDLRRACWERCEFGVVGLVIAFGVRPRLGRWAARQVPSERLAQAARIAGATVLALGASDLLLRLKWPGEGPRLLLACNAPDARYAWTNVASHTVATYGARAVRYDIDDAGNRVRAGEVVDPTRPTILFTGESITFGFGLDYEKTYVPRVGDLLHVQTANVAVSAYGIDQQYLRMHDQLPRFARPVAVVTLVLATQIVRNVLEDRPHIFPRADGSMAYVDETPPFLRNSPLRRLWRTVVGERSTTAIAIARDCLQGTAREVRARGALPLFVFTNWGPPCLPDEQGTPAIERELFAGVDGPHIHVDLDPTLWDATIDHPDPRAHGVLASAIAGALRPALTAATARDAAAPEAAAPPEP